MANNSRIERLNLYSDFLKKRMGLNIYMPNSYGNHDCFPVLYFLHGRSGSEDIIFDLDILRSVDALICEKVIKPLIIVCPRLENSRGINSALTTKVVKSLHSNGLTINLGRYEDYFIKEVIPFIDRSYKTINSKKGRFIGGVSAGGYSALNYGLRYSNLFSKIGGHMPVLELELDQEDTPYFNTIDIWKKNNPLYIAKECVISPDCQIYLDAGNKDEGEFYNGCLELHNILIDRNITVQNHIFEGHHNIEYIKSNLEKYLTFYAAS